MGSVDICIGHDDDFTITQFLRVERAFVLLFIANSSAKGPNHPLDLLV